MHNAHNNLITDMSLEFLPQFVLMILPSLKFYSTGIQPPIISILMSSTCTQLTVAYGPSTQSLQLQHAVWLEKKLLQ